MAALWNPRALLGVNPDGPFTCVGTTQKGARCRNSFFSNSDLTEASNLLNRMAVSHPRDARAHLSNLAEITLCPRWHRKPGYSQVESMKRKWWNIIASNYPEPGPARSVTYATSNPEPIPRNSGQASRSTVSTSSSRSLPTPPPSPLPASQHRPLTPPAPVARSVTPRTLRTPTTPLRIPTDSPARSRASSNVAALSASSSVVVDTPPASRTPLRSPTRDGSDNTSSSASSTRTATTHAALVTPPQSPLLAPAQDRSQDDTTSSPAAVSVAIASPSRTTPLTPRRPRPQPTSTWLPLTPEAPITVSPCPHSSRRKPLTDECPICNEEIHCPDDAVWCRAQCGQNMHRGCFGPWRRECLDREVAVTCVYCRAPWKYEWED